MKQISDKTLKEIKKIYTEGHGTSILANKNKEGIKEIAKLLDELGISNYRIKDTGIIITTKESLKTFAKNINFNIKRKREKLQNLLGRYKEN